MKEAVGDVLPYAVGVALSPIAIVAVILMLLSRRARVNGPLFVIGWLVGLAIIGAIVLGIAGPSDANDNGAPATWVAVLKIVLGVLLVLTGIRRWRDRSHADEEAPMPKWMGAVDGLTPVRAGGAGAALSALNPKNLILAVGAAAAIAGTGISGGEQAGAYAIFAVIATVGVAIPVVVYFALGDRADALLNAMKARMGRHNAAIMATLCLVIGAKLIGDGIAAL